LIDLNTCKLQLRGTTSPASSPNTLHLSRANPRATMSIDSPTTDRTTHLQSRVPRGVYGNASWRSGVLWSPHAHALGLQSAS